MQRAATNDGDSGYSSREIIARPELVKKMRGLSLRRNIFLTAPGGYGKTVAATQWLASVRGEMAIMTIGGEYNEPDFFYQRLTQSLCRLCGLKQPTAGFSAADLINMNFPAKHTRCYLLIDDLYKLEVKEILSSLPLIAARLPRYICLCLSSRSEPSEELINTGRFEVLTQEDLRFSPEEVEWLGAEKDHELTGEQISGLLDTTGGWAIYLSALLSGGQGDATPQTLSQYFEKRVWSLRDDETKDTLLRLSVPAEITPELCGRLTGQEDGRGVLEGLLKRQNAFLSHDGGNTYRFHDVFREFLLSHAEGMEREKLRRLNRIAAEWYFERGDYLTSAGHFIKNLDHEGISRCMDMSNRYLGKENGLSVELRLNFTVQYVKGLPETFIASNPYLLTRCAIAAYHNGDISEHLRYLDLLYQQLCQKFHKLIVPATAVAVVLVA